MLQLMEVPARMGLCLLHIQAAEHVIKLTLQHVIRNDSITLEMLEAVEEAERKKTLGYFLAKLRKRADLVPEFDEMLQKFLGRRNTFAHNLSEIPGWSLETEEGRQVAIKWLDETYQLTEQISKVFWGLVRVWELHHDNPHPIAGEGDFFKDIDPVYTTVAKMVFRPKSD